MASRATYTIWTRVHVRHSYLITDYTVETRMPTQYISTPMRKPWYWILRRSNVE